MSVPCAEVGPRARLEGLTSLRFFAALGVVLCHVGIVTQGGPQEPVARSGYVGVTFFFVLSGFVLVWSYRPGSAARFIGHRLARIWPLHALTWAVALVALAETRRTSLQELMSLLLVHMWGLAGSAVPDASNVDVANGVSWTLSCELAFYLTVPFIAPRLLRASRGWLIAVLAMAASAEHLVPDVMWSLWPQQAAELLLHAPAYRYLEFLVGMTIAALLRSGLEIQARIWPAALLVLSMYVLVASGAFTGGPEASRAMLLPFAALIAVTAAAGLRRQSWLEHPWIVNRGGASFALYLVHFPIMLAFGHLASGRGLSTRMLLGLVALLLALLVAEVAHRWFEKPVERLLRSRIDRAPGRDDVATKTAAAARIAEAA